MNESKNTANGFKRYFLVSTSVILGSFLVFGLVFYIFSGLLDNKMEQILASRNVVAGRSNDLENLNSLKTDSVAAQELQKKMDALLPTQDGLVSFPQFVENLARNHSLSSTFSFRGSPVPPVSPNPGFVDFNSSVEGDPNNIRAFVQEFESGTTRFLINLHELTLLPNNGGYRADLQGRVFFKENIIGS